MSISAVITGAAGDDLIKEGEGTLVLSGANTYDGATKVNAGTLLINGDQSAANGEITIGDGTGTDTLGGVGTIGGNVTGAGGRLTAATDSTSGILTMAGGTAISASSSSTWLVNLNYTDGGDDSMGGTNVDFIDCDFNSSTTIDPTNFNLAVNTTGGTGWTYAWGEKYRFASYGTWIGSYFANAGGDVGLGSTRRGYVYAGGDGGTFVVDYTEGGNYFTLMAVPEPATWSVLALALALATMGARRRRRLEDGTVGVG